MIQTRPDLTAARPAGARSRLDHAAPPGSAAEVKDGFQPSLPFLTGARVTAPADAAGTDESKQPLWRRAVLAGALACTAVTGMAGQALAAQTAPRTSAVDVLSDAMNRDSRLQVTVIPERMPRIDLVRRSEWGRGNFNGDSHRNRDVDYSPVGVHLGDGMVMDTNGNLVLVPALTYGWGLTVSDFAHVDIGKGDDTVTRFGSTVHYNETSSRRQLIFERSNGAEIMNGRGRTQITRDGQGNFTATGPDGMAWEILKTPTGYRVLPGNGTALRLEIGPQQTQVLQGGRLIGGVDVLQNELRIAGPGGKAEMVRSEGGHIVEIEGHFSWPDHRLIKDGRLTLGTRDSHRIEVDPPAVVNDARTRYQQILQHLEAVEPGWAEKHPVVAAVLEYAAANPTLLAEEGDPHGLLQGGTALATAGGTIGSGMALSTAGTALSLAESAKALGAAALSAKAAAQAAAAAGNMSQAAALAQEAQSLGNQARAMGGRAMELGESARNTAQVARIMLGVAGALQIVDGAFDVRGGQANRSIVDGAIAVTQSQMDELREVLRGPELERAMEDYSKVMRVLEYLRDQADKDVTVGGLKIGFGAILLVSALMGPQAPMALTIIGIAGTAGTAVYEHWDEIEAFLTGERQDVPRFLDLLPDGNHIRIDLGNPRRSP